MGTIIGTGGTKIKDLRKVSLCGIIVYNEEIFNALYITETLVQYIICYREVLL